MSSNRISVGILITPADADIAAFFNDLRTKGQKPAKWLSGMLIANEKHLKFPIPDHRGESFMKATPKSNAPAPPILFGSGTSSAETQEETGKWKYGWQVRGSKGEIIEGTVVSVSFCRPEIIAIIQQMQHDHLKISTYLKALIRHNMSHDTPAVIDERNLTQIMQEYYLEQSRKSKAPPAPVPEETPVVEEPIVFDDVEKNPLLGYI